MVLGAHITDVCRRRRTVKVVSVNTEGMSLYCTVYEEGNIARAADVLFLSHQAVSKRIKSIEAELGVTLFERSVKGLVPTIAGQDAYRTFRSMLASYDKLQMRLRDAKAERPVIHMGIEFYNIDSISLDRVVAFEGLSSEQARISVKYLTNMECYRQLLAKRIDLAITNRPFANANKFDFISLNKSRAYIAVSANDPLAHKETLSPADFEGQTFLSIIDAEGTNRFIVERFAELGVHLLADEVAYDMGSLSSMIRNGRGFHVVPEAYMIPLAGDSGIVTRVLPGFRDVFEIGIVLAKSREPRRAVDEFVSFLAADKNFLKI